jgi:hypothetical protein
MAISRCGFIIGGIAVFLASVEVIAWWWMNPRESDDSYPILTYQARQASQALSPEGISSGPGESGKNTEKLTFTSLPEIYQNSAPKLRCSGGEVLHAQLGDRTGLHIAYFEWDGTDTGSVLEAFRHTPEICLGSLGMELVSKEKPITWELDGRSLVFDHIIFREPLKGRGVGYSQQVHTFRAVWVEGMDGTDYREGLLGDQMKRLGPIRLKSALSRYRPAHARVIQGAVRGVPNGAAAWELFEKVTLDDLRFVKHLSAGSLSIKLISGAFKFHPSCHRLQIIEMRPPRIRRLPVPRPTTFR